MTTNNSNLYPFLTKKQITARIIDDKGFALQCLAIMDGRQTDDEKEIKDTVYKNRRGWMSSHAKKGTELAAKAASGETLTDAEIGEVQALVGRYTKQLASHFRNVEIERNPGLKAQAACFFTPQPAGPKAAAPAAAADDDEA